MDRWLGCFMDRVDDSTIQKDRCSVPLGLGVMLVLLCGCPSAVPPPAPDPVLPPSSSIPEGVYSGTLVIMVTLRYQGDVTNQSETIPFTIVIDTNGRFLDADGIPFMVNKTYGSNTGALELTNFCRSISVDDDQVLIRFDIRLCLKTPFFADLSCVRQEVGSYETPRAHG